MGFELQQLGESFPAVFAAQRLLVLTLALLLCSASKDLRLRSTFRSGGVTWLTVICVLWLQLMETFSKLFKQLLIPTSNLLIKTHSFIKKKHRPCKVCVFNSSYNSWGHSQAKIKIEIIELRYVRGRPGSPGRHHRPGSGHLCTDQNQRTPGRRAPPILPPLLSQVGCCPERSENKDRFKSHNTDNTVSWVPK